MNAWEQAALGIAAVLIGSAITYWASYVTRGAAKAGKHDGELKTMRESIEAHERREEEEFRQIRDEIGAMREDVQGLGRQVGEMHGELSGIGRFIRNGRKE